MTEHDDDLDPNLDLDAYEAMAPTDGFADRVLARRDAAPASATVPAADASVDVRAGNPVLKKTAVVVGVAAAAVLVFALARGTRMPASSGSLVADARTTVALGTRGVAVAEAGASLRWQVAAGGATDVDQTAGGAFYRVDAGGPFVVRTPAGDVTVTGTCFSVEVQPVKPSKQALTGAAIGAAVSATVLLTVYEGRVLFANDKGKTEVVAGQAVVAGAHAPPVAVDLDDVGPGETVASGALAPPSEDATRAQLLARDEAQRAEIARLRKRMANVADGGRPVAVRKNGGNNPRDDEDWFDNSPERLAEFAKTCRVRVDAPPVFGAPLHPGMAAHLAERFNLSDEQAAEVVKVLEGFRARAEEEVRALYIEATGDVDGAAQLSVRAMVGELRDKAPPDEDSRVRRKIANERAGLAAPPASLAGLSPYERYFRLLASSGDDFEAMMAEIIGPERARTIREDGPAMRMDMDGCPDEDGSSEDAGDM